MKYGAPLVLLLAIAFGCTTLSRSRVLVPYTLPELPDRVAIEAVNASGHELPMPQAGLLEQVARLITKQPDDEPSLVDAFARAASERLGAMKIAVAPAAKRRLRISLAGWDFHGGGTAGSLVFVTASYELLDPGGERLWQVEQTRLPIRIDGPDLSRTEVAHIARRCVEQAFASLR
jgi:hypothetical protein